MDVEGKLRPLRKIHLPELGGEISVGLAGNGAGHETGPLTKVADMVERHSEGILNFLWHPITNAAAEGPNPASKASNTPRAGCTISSPSAAASSFSSASSISILPNLPPLLPVAPYFLIERDVSNILHFRNPT